MAGMGPPPKPNARRRNADTLTGDKRVRCPECGTPKRESVTCSACGTSGVSKDVPGATGPRSAAPELPTPSKWLSATRDWWESWRSSVQTAHFQPSDWQTLRALLPLVDAMNRENKDPLKRMKLFEAVHKAEKSLGGTHLDRLRGRIDASDPGPGGAVGYRSREAETPDGVTVLDEYRDMLG